MYRICIERMAYTILSNQCQASFRPLGYERVYLSLYKVADTPFHIQRGDLVTIFHFGARNKMIDPYVHTLALHFNFF